MSHALKRKLVSALSQVLHPTTSPREFDNALSVSRTLLASHNQSLADLMDTGTAPTQNTAQIQALTDQIMSLRAREARLCQDLTRANSLAQQQAQTITQQVEQTQALLTGMEDLRAKFDRVADHCEALTVRLKRAEEDLLAARRREARVRGELVALKMAA